MPHSSSLPPQTTKDNSGTRYSRSGSSISAQSASTASTETDTEPLHQQKNGQHSKKLEKEIQVVEAPDWPSLLVDVERDVGKGMGERLFHWGPLLAFGIIFTIGLTTLIVHLEYWPLVEPFALINMSIFLYLNYGVMFNLMRASYVGGGYVTKGWRPPNKDDERKLQYCASCEGFKAPRSHHCKKCNRCVMKMDHHCPWINNCVGHRNHTYFIKFLFFAVVGCLHSVIILGFILYHTIWTILYRGSPTYYRGKPNPYMIRSLSTFIFVLLSISFAVGVIIAVGVLLYTQVRAVLTNKTGIEDYICAKVVYRGGADEFTYPYSLGWRRNWREVFPSPWASYPRGNGIWWPIRANCSQYTLSKEQIIQKTNKRYAAHIFDITQDGPGGLCGGRKAGFKALVCQPCSDEARIEIKKGEAYAVTRINKHWLYGQRLLQPPVPIRDQDSEDEVHGPFSENPYEDRVNRDRLAIKQALEPRGWFPRAFSKHRPRPKVEQ